MAFVPDELDGAQITQDTARISVSDQFDARYIRYMLSSPFVTSQVRANTMGLAVQGINLGDLRKINIPICSLDQQIELADELVDIDAAIRSSMERCAYARSLLSQLREKLFSRSDADV